MEPGTAYIVGNPLPLIKVVSGGQTGVDRAALDAAMELGIEVGGWCPKGRRAVDGPIPEKYPLTETQARNYNTRTKWNVRDSDATLIVCRDEPTEGTALTIRYCEKMNKPHYVYQLKAGETLMLDGPEDPHEVLYWFHCHGIQVLNVAGPREGKHCPIYERAHPFLAGLFQLLQQNQGVREPIAKYDVLPKLKKAA